MCTADTGVRARNVAAAMALCAGWIVVALVPCAGPAWARPSSTMDTYQSVRGATPLTIAHDRIQVLARSGISRHAFRQFWISQNLVLQDSLVDRHFIFTFSPPETLDRRELVARARQLKQAGATFISDAGLSVIRAGGTAPMIATDTFIARLKQGVRSTRIDTLNARYGVRIVERNRHRPGQFLLSLTPRTADSLDVIVVANRFHAESTFIAYAHPNFVHVIRHQQYDPGDAEYKHQWHHDTKESPSATEDSDIDTPLAWSIIRALSDPPETVIAVIDGGFDMAHDDLKNVFWTNVGETGPDRHGDPKETNGDDDDENGYVDDVHGWNVYDCDDADAVSEEDCGDGDPSYVVYEDLDPYTGAMVKSVDSAGSHGTPVAGLAAGESGNGIGTAGVSMGAGILAIRRGESEYALVKAFDYARVNGADVINCSWAMYTPKSAAETASLDEAIRDAVEPSDGRGAVVVFAMDYAESEAECGNDEPAYNLASRSDVLAVGSVSDLEKRLAASACGDYLDVLAPSDLGEVAGQGTLHITTTDVSACDGASPCYGFNSQRQASTCPDEASDDDYTYCFTGTSAAAPIAAGVAGLILTADPTVEPEAVRSLIQDTADRVEPTVANYEGATGFSRPPATPSTHGYGRVNAYEAVRIAAPTGAGGKGGVDIFVRDNVYDWGNTEQPSNTLFEPEDGKARGYKPHWKSEDIKVDAPPYQIPSTSSPGAADQEIDSKQFDELEDEDPLPGERNAVYFRVRNRGYNRAEGVKTKLYWTHVTTVLPRLPDDFWTGFATNTFTSGDWTFLGERPATGSVALDNSGSTVARESRESTTGVDPAAVHYFEWTGPDLTPDVRNHFCLLGIVDSNQDHPAAYQLVLDGTPPDPVDDSELFEADHLTPTDNNVTHRNYWIEDTTTETNFQVAFYVRNSGLVPRKYRIHFKPPEGWKVRRQGSYPPTSDFIVDPRRPPKLARFVVTAPRRGATGTMRFDQLLVVPGAKADVRTEAPGVPIKKKSVEWIPRPVPKVESTRLAGGVTIDFRPRTSGNR